MSREEQNGTGAKRYLRLAGRNAGLCTELGRESRETVWIRERFEDVARSQNLSGRGALDRLVFARLYGRPPEKSTEQLSIRYWRTGRHKPQSRGAMPGPGAALALDEADTAFLLQATTTALIGFSLPPTIRTRSTAGAEAIWKLWRPNTWPRSTRWNWSD